MFYCTKLTTSIGRMELLLNAQSINCRGRAICDRQTDKSETTVSLDLYFLSAYL